MHTSNKHSHNTTLRSLTLSIVVAFMFMTVVAGSASASVSGGQPFASGPLVAPFSGSSSVVSPFSLVRNGDGSFGSFSGGSPQALTVDQATGDIYAMEPATGKLWRFDSTGAAKNFTAGPDAGTNSITGLNFQEFAGFDEVAVDSSSGPAKGDIYVTESGSGRINVFSSTGEPLGMLKGSGDPNGGFGEDCGVAVDQSNGDLYVASRGFDIWRYSPTGGLVSESDYSGGIEVSIEPCQLAVANGSLYAKQWQEFPIFGAGPLEKYSTSAFTFPEIGFGSATLVAQNVTGVATDPSTGDVYADLGNKISVFDSAGSALYTFGSSSDFGSESSGVAMDSSTGNAYVADPSHQRVDVYGPAFVAPPTVTTGQAGEINHVKATLNGHLDLNGGPEITDCHFDWGATNAYGNTTPCAQGNNYTTASDVSATITNLEPGKIYHYRLSVTNTAGTATGADQTLETPGVVAHRDLVTTIGQDGTSATSFSVLRGIAFRPSTASLYALDLNGIYGFNVSASPVYTPLAGFSPLATSAEGGEPGFAVDTTKLSSAGNLYFVSEAQGKIYGFDSTGAALGGAFPIDVSTTPGAPAGSPADLCGAAVDSTGQLWVSNYATRHILRYSATGAFQGGLDLSAQGLNPCHLAFDSNDDLYVTNGNGSSGQQTWRYTASSAYATATLIDSQGGAGLAFNLSDHHLFIASSNQVREYDSSHNLVATFADNVPGALFHTLAVDPVTDHIFLLDLGNNNIRVYGLPVLPPEVSIASASAIANSTATVSGSVSPQGFTLSDCHFEYARETDFQANGFTGAAVAPCSPAAGAIPADLDDHSVSADISGLDRNTAYHYRLVVTSGQGTSVTSDATFITTGPAEVETVGSPIRTATTARLEGRLDPHSAPTTYHFEYGDRGPCDSNPCTATTSQAAGSGDLTEFVSQQVTGLQPNTTYHYRLVADNGNIDGAISGTDYTLITRSSDAPLSHGHLPGPPGSDRAWERVSLPDTGGTPVIRSLGVSDNGERAMYALDGGSPGSQVGGGPFGDNDQYAERTASGWESKSLFPTRAQAPGNQWSDPIGLSDLSRLYAINEDATSVGPVELWRMSPGAPAEPVFTVSYGQYANFTAVSADGSRILAVLRGSFDPAHPVGPQDEELYDITSGTPHMVGLLPDGSIPSCGVKAVDMSTSSPSPEEGWVTSDGSHAFFDVDCSGSGETLYVRDLAGATTVQLAAHARFIRSTGGVAFFTTKESLVAGDLGGNDIYRYTVQDGSLDCLTCAAAAGGSVISGDASVVTDFGYVAVSADGTRVYFRSARRLLAGAAEEGIYRLDVPGRNLAYVAPARGANIGALSRSGNAISPDGSVFVFQSDNLALNAVNGAQNGGTRQDYRYDDTDRSLVCVSCPGDGSLPRGALSQGLEGPLDGRPGIALTSDGDLVFVTPTPLVAADQNTARSSQDPVVGEDVYEWREGRLLLVTDGQAYHVGALSAPEFMGASRDGRDIFFTQAAQLTPDAIDAQTRLYDARIGGGFDFPQPPPACSLDACQGNPSPPPNDQTPGSETFSGPGNHAKSQVPSKKCAGGGCVKGQLHKRCVKGKVLKHGKCVKKRRHGRVKKAKRANYNHGGAK